MSQQAPATWQQWHYAALTVKDLKTYFLSLNISFCIFQAMRDLAFPWQ